MNKKNRGRVASPPGRGFFWHPKGYIIFLISSVKAGTTSKRSPTTP